MNEENYNYRTSQTLLRNQFPGKGNCKSQLFQNLRKGRVTLTISY